jgi:mannan endo-1,4-beta-mannosidase
MIRNALLLLLFPGLILLCSCKGMNRPGRNSSATGMEAEYMPADSQAVQSAVDLYGFLKRMTGKGTMIGHQDALAYGMGWKGDEFRTDINDVCGDFPAVFGWDLGHIGDSVNIDGVPFDRMRQWAIEVHLRGGINTCSWHVRNLVTGTNAWDITPCVAAVLPGGDRHAAFLEKLDLVAAFFQSLRTSDGEPVPVIFRPWHEMSGGWFWWGTNSCTPEEYKSLFRFTEDYLRNTKKIHNLLYAYSTDAVKTATEYMAFYPGDDYIDILGFDDYGGMKDRESSSRTVALLDILDSIATVRSKPFAMTETGLETIPDSTWFTGVVLPVIKADASTRNTCWVLFWRNGRPDHFYAPFPGHPSAPDFIKFREDEATWFLSDIHNLYKSPEE